MKDVENKGAPWLGGWAIAAGAGVVAGGACLVVGKFDYTPAVAIGTVIFLLVGAILTWLGSMPSHAAPPMVLKAAPAPAAPPPAAAPAAAPVMAAPVMAAPAPSATGTKPASLSAARGGRADDLKIIKGIGPKLEKLCHQLGFFHFDQVAAWTPAEVAWVDENLEGFKGRVTRDRWVPQAKAIVQMGSEEFLRQLDAGKEF